MSAQRVAVVGAGNWGKNLVRTFHALGVLIGVAEPSASLRKNLREQYSDLNFYSFEDLLESDVDALAIATPASTHFDFAKRALRAGKHVFVEKPLTLTLADAQSLVELTETADKTLMVGHLLLYQPAISWIKEYLESGAAGEVWHVATRRAKLGRVRNEENVWWSFAPHDVSVVLYLLGNPELRSVQAHGHKMLPSGVEDNVQVSLAFSSGQTAALHSSWYWPENERKTVVLAEKKMIVYDELAQKVEVFDKTVDEDLNHHDAGSFVADVADAEPLRLECQHFLDCLASGQRPLSDVHNGVAVVDILERAQRLLDEHD